MLGPSHKMIIGFLGVISIGSLFMKQGYSQVAKGIPSEFIIRPNIEYKEEDLRNPFQSPKEKEETKRQELQEKVQIRPLPTLTIQGIVWGGSLAQAIINNKVVRVGDKIEEVCIIDINKDGITLIFDEQQYKLNSPAVSNIQHVKVKQEIEGGKNEE